ncbi:putative arabinose 5-phosphate isomerase [Cladorrhinum samala]|uniref:Arabinose 5-phosphate isomerase n=1 Tax=Cladorrhinum samala TaxID=585594 RepID=A0AAV9H8W0_9PEZI|nr:putative arabinose 5-phosphate isomerase [Cladorrhinum samala]
MVEQRQQRPAQPVHNSEVYLLRQMCPTFSTIAPLSPPSPITPEEDDFCGDNIEALALTQPAIAVCDKKLAVEKRLSNAVHVLSTEATALQDLTALYSSDRVARDGFNRAVEAITRGQQKEPDSNRQSSGKLVVIGVGKSGHIAKKLVATFNSLSIRAVFLHPTEALHGDLGLIGCSDTLLVITFSGKTPELLTLLPHIDKSLPLILLTSHTRPETCELIRHRPDTILLPAPIHEPESKSFGVSAPTTSTTVALAVGDALAIVVAQELHIDVAPVFAKNHPGGAIGAAFKKPSKTVRNIAVALDRIPTFAASLENPTGADVLRTGYASPSGWVKTQNGIIPPTRIRRLTSSDFSKPLSELGWLVATDENEFVPVPADSNVQKAAEWVEGMRDALGSGRYEDDAVVRVMEKGKWVAVLEVGRLLEAK